MKPVFLNVFFRSVMWVSAATLISACNSGSGIGGTNGNPPAGGTVIPASSMDMVIESPAANVNDALATTAVQATVYIPEHIEGTTYPLVIHSHGWGGSRVSQGDVDSTEPQAGTTTTSFFTLIDQRVEVLWNAGYAVISFDERGFGRTDDGDTGTADGAHVMSLDYEIQDAIAVLDWAAANLDVTLDGPGDPVVGAIGGSYGGAYQLMLAAADPRVDAIIPGATWHSLAQSLAPNNVIKKGFTMGLCTLAQTDQAELSDEVTAACQEGAFNQTTKYREELSQRSQDIFLNNGINKFKEDGAPPPEVDALLIQGNRDILFDLTQAYDNYRYLSQNGRDVRLLTHENGHSLRQTRSGPGSQGALGTNTCGTIDSMDAIKIWLDSKLRGSLALNALPPICISLNNTQSAFFDTLPEASAANIAMIPAASSVNGTQHNNLRSATAQALFFPMTAPISGAGKVVAGVPIARVTLTTGLGGQEGVVFLGTGIRRAGNIILADDQVVPIRTSDSRVGATPEPVQLPGVGEILMDGDELGVLVYGAHDQFDNEARNLWNTNQAMISGNVQFPVSTPTITTRAP